MDFAQVGDKPIKGTWRACDDEGMRAIVEGYIDLRVVGKILVYLRNVGLKVFKEQAVDRQHWRGLSLSTVD